MLAEQANMSPRTFARQYKQKTGITPAKAIEVFRLEAARRMVEDSDQTLTQIALSCGFGDEELLDLVYVLVGMAWAARAWPLVETGP